MFESNGQTFKSFALEQQEDGRLEEQSEQQRLRSEYNQTFPIKRLPFEVLKVILNELTLTICSPVNAFASVGTTV